MGFLSPERLWLLLAVAALAVAYGALQQRRRSYTARLASADLLASVVPRSPGWRRHVTAAVLLLGLSTLVVALAQPTNVVRVPRERATVIVAIDVSLSMEANDVDPTRLEAAQVAAATFIEELPETLNVGIVSFAGSASVLVPPTTDREAAYRAVEALDLAEATGIGEAIFTSIEALQAVPAGESADDLPPARIVLLSDGETTVGRPDSEAVAAALRAEIPVSTIAFGTPFGTILYDNPDTEFVEDEVISVPVGEDNLRAIADGTGGTFFAASSLEELEAVYADIGSAIGYEDAEREITDWFVAGALALLVGSSLLSLLWFQRLP
ncbi:MAG: VWA domain-containing protein [Acidimicrobiales bacterium]